jgi:group I intron endonuclease
LAGKRKSLIQKAFAAHGIKSFSFVVIEECNRELLNEREVFWIAHFDCMVPNGYNLTSGGGQGKFISEETRHKTSEALKGKPLSDETRRKMSEARKGMKLSDETRQKMSETKKNLPEETRQKLSEAGRAQAKFLSSQPDHPCKVQVTCPYCGKTGRKMPMTQWHFENCRIKEEATALS